VESAELPAAALVELLAQQPRDLLTDGRELLQQLEELMPEAQAAIVGQKKPSKQGKIKVTMSR